MSQPKSHIYEGDVRARAVSSSNLNTRLTLNARYQSADFHSWLHRRLDVERGEHVLDVGCGTGAQSLRFLEVVGSNGSVSSLDISESSVEELKASARQDSRLTAVASDMADLRARIDGTFRQKTYTLAHSSYALYYSPARLDVLRTMADALVSSGRLAIFTPSTPHGMVEIAQRYSTVPSPVLESLEFGQAVLEPAMRKMFWEVAVHFFQSEMRVTALEDFMEFYSATTYYDARAEPQIRAYAEREIKAHGAVRYEKNGYLIIGRDRR